MRDFDVFDPSFGPALACAFPHEFPGLDWLSPLPQVFRLGHRVPFAGSFLAWTG
ncbi:MAG: hypothetical protein RMI91_15065 [Gemmatales bacterium]|nr:hypothetical protein [Gemmatales bacterium]